MQTQGLFLDCHCHALWDFDDGVKTKDEALALLRCANITGITTIFVTPHLVSGGFFNPEKREIEEKLQDLKKLGTDNNIPIELKLACEFRINEEALESIVQKRYVCYQDTDWLLIEFTRRIIDTRVIDDAVYELSRMGVNCLIAHPERYFDNEKQAVDTCKKWKALGCHFQINRTSLMGTHGSRADKISWRLVEEGFAHIVASDAHQGEGRRECRLDDVYGMIERRFDQGTADTLCIENPTRLSKNMALLPISVKKSWWRR